jgi:hypothetical protein
MILEEECRAQKLNAEVRKKILDSTVKRIRMNSMGVSEILLVVERGQGEESQRARS